MKKYLSIAILTMLIGLSVVTGISPGTASADEVTPISDSSATEVSELNGNGEESDESTLAENSGDEEVSITEEDFETKDATIEENSEDVATTVQEGNSETTAHPVVAVKQAATTSVIPADGKEVNYTLTSSGSNGEFIANYLSPYFQKPAVVKEEAGKKYAYITLVGKAYGFTKIQVVKADGTKEDAEILSTVGEKLDQVRIIKVALTGETTTNLSVDGGTFGQYSLTLNFEIKEDSTASEEYSVQTTWIYNGEEWSRISNFLNTTAVVKVINGENIVSFKDISSIITELKVNGQSLNIVDGVAEFKADNSLSDATVTIAYMAGERAMSHDFTVKFASKPSDSEENAQTEVKEEQVNNEVTNENAVTTEESNSNDKSDSEVANLSFDRGSDNSANVETTTDSGSNGEESNPKTSDVNELVIYILLLVSSLVLLGKRYLVNVRETR